MICKGFAFALPIKTLQIFIKALLIFALGGGGAKVSAVEPTNWIFGVGFGAGQSQLSQIYADSANALITGNNGLINGFSATAGRLYGSTIKDWGFVWEFLVGYKHWLNDWVGFRYYANVSGQHYKDDIFTTGKTQAGVIEYTANADLLLNFYNSEFFTFGIFGGFGVGGAYFDSPAFDTYKAQWSSENSALSNARFSGLGEIHKHHLSATLSAGVRFNIFQKIRNIGQRTCAQGADGRRTCKVPISYFEHSIEINSKFSLMTYKATDESDIFGGYCGANSTWNNASIAGQFKCLWRNKPGYEVKNPYKFTLRYIFAF